jgi:hypothetical protein
MSIPVGTIGTLAEGALHAQLKEWYRRQGDLIEHPVGGFVVDIVRGDLLIEIQTGGFTPLRRKVQAFPDDRRIRVVAPIAVENRIIRIGEGGEVLSSRRSPKRGRLEEVFGRLVALPELLGRFELEVLLIEQQELRTHQPGKAFRRRGWVVQGRSLVRVIESIVIPDAAAAAAVLPADLPAMFHTGDIAAAAAISRRTAQQMAYCLRRMGQIEPVGKSGNAVTYARTG